MSWFKNKVNEDAAALAELQASFASVQADLVSARAELKDAQELAATYLAEFTRTDAENKANLARIAEMEAELAETSRDAATFDDKVASAAASAVATMGHAPLEIVEEDDVPVDVVAKFKGLKGAELVQFYKENKQAISRALAGK
jgi:chromosome segregation ATPase